MSEGGFKIAVPEKRGAAPKHVSASLCPDPPCLCVPRPAHSEEQMGGLWTGIRPVHIATTSKMVSDYSGMLVQPHKVCVVWGRGG